MQLNGAGRQVPAVERGYRFNGRRPGHLIARGVTTDWRISGKLPFRPVDVRGMVLMEDRKPTEKLSLPQVFGSVMASFLGVQKNATRERDFRRGRARDFILVGIVLTLLFILAIWGVVQLVMQFAIQE